ncbi:response regulator transcription factor [Streptomyces sp. R28]|uniref:Response regulator transcription factor n=1 Tax=Streptomyces sp. R28 TaxID=3238628 RepID=A0AB39PR85_9ACTN
MLELLAWATAEGGCHERAARLLGAADALWRDAGSSISAFGPQMAAEHARCEAGAVAALGRASYRKVFEESRLLHYALEPDQEPIVPSAPHPLTARKQEVAELVAQGMTNRQIAAVLVVSSRTVEGHVENIRGKLGLARRTQVAIWWAAKEHQSP